MKKAVCYGMLPRDLSDADRLALAREAGLEGVEMHQYETLAEAEKLAELAKDAGVEIHSVMNGTNWKWPITSTDEETRQQGIAGTAEGLRQAQAAGAPVFLLVPGIVTADVSYGAALENATKSIRELLPVCEETGVILAVENVWNRFLLNPFEMRDFLDQFGSPYVQAYFDVGNILIYGYPHQWIEVLGPRLKKIHVKDFDMGSRNFVGLLQGDVDFPRVMAALRGVGYDNYLTAETSAYKQYPAQFVRDTAAQLAQIIAS